MKRSVKNWFGWQDTEIDWLILLQPCRRRGALYRDLLKLKRYRGFYNCDKKIHPNLSNGPIQTWQSSVLLSANPKFFVFNLSFCPPSLLLSLLSLRIETLLDALTRELQKIFQSLQKALTLETLAIRDCKRGPRNPGYEGAEQASRASCSRTRSKNALSFRISIRPGFGA